MKVQCITEESLFRPEAVRWRERMNLLEPMGDAVVILPCSMRKPYSSSRSHLIFMKVTKGIQECILTSPFGVCPREMEKHTPYNHMILQRLENGHMKKLKLLENA